MRRLLGIATPVFASIVFLMGSTFALNRSVEGFVNRINGQVYDPMHRPVPDVNVELLDEVNALLSRTKTNGAGAFTFVGISRGHFQVRVLPYGTGLLGDIKDVEVTPLYANGSDSVYVDFYLRYEKRVAPPVPVGPGEAIFAQDVPASAKKLFESGVSKLERSQVDGLKDVKAAVDAFPLYFDALSLLGREYVKQEKFSDGYPYLLHAIDVYQRSASVYYSLAIAFYRLGQLPAASKAIDACLLLNGASADANLLRGTILRQLKSYKEAEEALLKALSVYKNSNAEVHWQLALVYNRTGRNAEAIQHLEQYLKIYPSSPDKKNVQDLIAKLKASQVSNIKPDKE